MTTALQSATTAPLAGQPTATRGSFVRRVFWISLAVILLFAATYLFAWFNAYQLSNRFVDEAATSFAAGKYLDALVGYREFDATQNRYVTRGGYVAIERMWSAPYSWPVPTMVGIAKARSQEIITQHLTVTDAEQYIQANTGRPGAPYFGEIYLRLGELYEAEDAVRDAEDIYTSLPTLFPHRPDLIEQANQHLARLQDQPE
ncbi:MAG: hypothetical protein KF832_27430 [Caldilineaceae bacterium]|nr:hypothetical protein [Caldilineaceae bacterium]